MKRPLYGLWLPFEGGHWIADVTGHDLVTEDHGHACGEAAGLQPYRVARVVPYTNGHFFHTALLTCMACKATSAQARGRWCPHSNPPVELETAVLARKLWEANDAVAALCVEVGEGREPSEELLQRLFDRDARGLRSQAEVLAKQLV
jgi:hypothetical protein